MVTTIQLSTFERSARLERCVTDSACYRVPYTPAPVPPGSSYTHVCRGNNYGAGRRGKTIRLIIDHTAEAEWASVVNGLKVDATTARKVSATAFTGEDGIGLSVPETDRPWTTGIWNEESLSNETIGKAAWTEAYWRANRKATIQNKILLFADWCRRHDIPARWLTADDIIAGKRGITDHLEANRAALRLGGDPSKLTHHDVGPGMRAILINTIIPAVATLLSQNTEIDMSTLQVPDPSRTYSTRAVDGAPYGAAQGQGFFGPGATRFCELGLDDAVAAFINVTVVSPAGPGFVVAWGDGPRPGTSNLNHGAGQTVANAALVQLVNGGVNVFSLAAADIIIEVQGVIR